MARAPVPPPLQGDVVRQSEHRIMAPLTGAPRLLNVVVWRWVSAGRRTLAFLVYGVVVRSMVRFSTNEDGCGVPRGVAFIFDTTM